MHHMEYVRDQRERGKGKGEEGEREKERGERAESERIRFSPSMRRSVGILGALGERREFASTIESHKQNITIAMPECT